MRLTLDAISGSGGGEGPIASERAPDGRHGPKFQGIYRKMSGHRIVAALAIASALAFGVTTQASASPILGIELLQGAFTYSTTSAADNPLMTSKSIGTFIMNGEINGLVTDPLSMVLTSWNVSSGAGG